MKKILLLFLFSLATLASGYSQAISPYLVGQNAWLPTALGGAVYNGQLDKLWSVVKGSKVQMIRIGGNGVEFNMPTNEQYISLIDSIRRIGAEPMVQVSEGRGKYTAAQAAAVVDHVNNVMKRNIKYWIIGNEPNLAGSHPTVNAAGVAAYTKAWSTAMKLKDPSILIVGPECAYYDSNYYPALVGGVNDITGKDENGNYYIDVISFHTYPFNGTQNRAQVLGSAQSFAGNVNNLIGLMNTANAKHGRTGSNTLKWALTEFNVTFRNPADNTVEGVNVHSFLNGQYWAEVFNVGMQKEAVSIQPWSIHESGGARVALDLGYLDGIGATLKPRSSYYHEMLIGKYLKGNYLAATDNQAEVTAFGSVFSDTTSIMILNKSLNTNLDFNLQLSDQPVTGTTALKINLLANINAAYADKVNAQSTMVLLFNQQGQLLRKVVYSLQHAAQAIPPSYLEPGQPVPNLFYFASDKQKTCVTQDADQVVFTASVFGDYQELNWNFGEGAVPQTASGIGPVTVKYTTPGSKTVTLTLVNNGESSVYEKVDYILARSCVREPYLSAPVTLPGLVKAVEFDKGGDEVAYKDSDVENRGALLNPTVPRADESVDTEAGGEGLGNIGYTVDGEWAKYTVAIKKTGIYKVTVRVASQPGGGSLRLLVNDVDKTGIVEVPKTDAWTTYQDLVISNVFLEASENATLKFEVVKSGFNTASFTFAEQAISGIVVNRIYNATSTGDGISDAVELLVTKDHLDIRGLIIKDFEDNLTTDNGGKYLFKDHALWKDLRIGTTIVLRRLAADITGYTEDLDPTDSKLDLLFENTTYLTTVSVEGHRFNLTNTDMVVLKTGNMNGVENVVHAFASNGGGGTAFFTGVTAPKLVSPVITGGGFFQYPLSNERTTADYDGLKATNSSDGNRNWGNGFGTNNIAYISSLRASIALPPVEPVSPPSMVVNRVYNGSNDGDGRFDAVELLVLEDHLDIRNLVVKDFESNITADNGGKYRFNNIPFWQDMRSGTTIVLRKLAGPAGYAQDSDPSNFTIDLLMENTGYVTNVSNGNIFNITQTDMVVIKTGLPTGVDGAIHAFGTRGGGANGVPSALYQSVKSFKMVSPNTDAGGSPSSSHYPLNPDKQVSDYNGAKGAISKTTSPNWGYGLGQNNIDYIRALRDAVAVPPTNLSATVSTANEIKLIWADNSEDETGFEVMRSLNGTTYALVANVAANATAYTDACLNFETQYYYKVRAKGNSLYSSNTAPASALTRSEPVLGSITGPAAPVSISAATVTLSAGFPDNNLTAATATWIWGDGTSSAGTISIHAENPITSEISDSHTYTKPGVYKVTLTVTDACSKTTTQYFEYVVIYDPNGGFTTGSGWFMSPVNAALPYMQVGGKASFGFEAKFQKGADALVDGDTEFRFQAGNLDFKSVSYDEMRLVISGNKASYKGKGTINGSGNYGFMVSALDGQYNGGTSTDKFRIKIWDITSNTTVYDNQAGAGEDEAASTTIGAGSIMVHNPTGKRNERISDQADLNHVLQEQVKTFPNPFQGQTNIQFVLENDEDYALDIYDLRGSLVKRLQSGTAKAGTVVQATWQPKEAAAGVYILRLTTSSGVAGQRLVRE